MSDNGLEFLDTNIIVYAHDASAGAKHDSARRLIERLWESHTGVLSVQVLQEFYVVVTQKVARPLDRGTAAEVISSLARWTIHTPKPNDVLRAIDLRAQSALSFWDAMIVNSAIAAGCSVLWSEDISSSGKYGQLRIVNPFAL